MPEWFFIFSAFVFGALFGSFGNVVILRMPRGESVVHTRSHCLSCGKPVRWQHNIPLLSWLWLRGRCADCGARFSMRYFWVELIMATLFALTVWKFGLSWTTLEYLIFIFALVCACFIDIDHMILPDKFTLSGIVIGLTGAALNPDAPRSFMDALLGVLAGGGFLWAVAYLYFVIRKRDGMGGGDIKLIAWIGAVLGWKAIPIVILLSSLVGSILGLTLAWRAKSKEGMQFAIPFGPYLGLAALIYMFCDGAEWGEWYLRLHGLE